MKGRTAALGFLVSSLLYGVIPMLFAFLAVREWLDPHRLLVPSLLAAALSAAVGTLLLVRKGKWGVLPAALLAGPAVQLAAMLIGYLAFGGVSMEGIRWLMPMVSFVAAVMMGLLFGQRRGGKRSRRKKR